TGRDDNVVIVGAHLDSVPVGPGINDDGSGVGTILEVAEDMKNVRPENTVRFAFWGAEEIGTIGSAYYLSRLPQEERDKIALYLNFDMIGSPNPVRFVYDGDGSEFGTIAPEGSAAIEAFFTDFYADRHLASEPTRIEFSSDYAIFFGLGIPFGGVFTGSSGIKTPEEAAVYGGQAGQPYDPCYHAACDTFAGTGDGVGATPPGLGLISLDQLSDGAAHSVFSFAMTTSAVPGTDKSSAKAANNATSLDYWGPKARK
ncbi:MAG TPA: M20/M25/M40 family metallo-hydrolase, partial [Acidimicrobiales bacterium]|nr:M20/M25/M40 family metallo-hydrolase [Acidimicrobiales bacterium]